MKSIAIFAGILVFVLFIAGIFISANNTAVKIEEDIIASSKNNENILSNYGKKVMETAQVPEMYRDDVVKVTKETMQGRYGQQGSKAIFQMLTEAQIPMNDKLYVQIQQVIESGRNDFQNGQTMLLDKTRNYKTITRTFPKGFILSMMGFPKIDLTKYEIVIDDRTAQVFATKREEAMTLRPKN